MSVHRRDIRHLCVFCGSSSGLKSEYREQAEAVGLVLAKRGISLVYGGGNAGVMGAVSTSLIKGGGRAIGVIPEALHNKVPHRDEVELHVVPHMHERKVKMYDMSDAFVALPGGIGTLEELFEALTWNQLGYLDKPMGLLNSAGYYDTLIAFLDQMVENGFLKPAHRERLVIDSSFESLLKKLYTAPVGYTGKWG